MTVPLPAGELWAHVVNSSSYGRWWPWVEMSTPDQLRVGQTVEAAIPSPLGFRVRVEVTPTAIAPELPHPALSARVGGDLTGNGSLSLRPVDAERTTLDLAWDVEVTRPLLKTVALGASPLLRWGHDRVVKRAVRSFVAGAGRSDDEPPAEPSSTSRPVLRAALIAGVLSGIPSTVHALATGRPPLAAARAAGSLLGRTTVTRGLLAHAAVTALWTATLTRLPLRRPALEGAAAGAAIAALDLGIVARRFPAIRRLPAAPQVADHLAFGALAAVVLAAGRPGQRGAVAIQSE